MAKNDAAKRLRKKYRVATAVSEYEDSATHLTPHCHPNFSCQRDHSDFLTNSAIQVKPYAIGPGELLFVDSDGWSFTQLLSHTNHRLSFLHYRCRVFVGSISCEFVRLID